MKTLLLFALSLWTISAHAWRCGTALIEVEDRQSDVLEACGEPTARYTQPVRYQLGLGDVHERRRYQTIDYWVYLTGRSQFARILRFEDGELTEIRRGDYGSAYEADPEECREHHQRIDLNQTKPELELRCGPPDKQYTVEEYELPLAAGDSHRLSRRVYVDEWIYYSGDLARVYRFENAVLKWQGKRDK